MVAEMLQKSNFLFYVLCVFQIYVICFVIYLLYIYMYIMFLNLLYISIFTLFDFKFVRQHFNFHYLSQIVIM